jgi:hypothetical protein
MNETSGSRTLHRLIYFSRQRPMADVDHEVDAIIRTSIQNNRMASITGLLLIHRETFVQALEGPAEAVLTTYGRIINDPRHSGSTIITSGPASKREFADWNMCARRMNPGDDAILDALQMREAFEPSKLTPRSAVRLLQAVRGIQSRSALRSIA